MSQKFTVAVWNWETPQKHNVWSANLKPNLINEDWLISGTRGFQNWSHFCMRPSHDKSTAKFTRYFSEARVFVDTILSTCKRLFFSQFKFFRLYNFENWFWSLDLEKAFQFKPPGKFHRWPGSSTRASGHILLTLNSKTLNSKHWTLNPSPGISFGDWADGRPK
jgi:hypothetical protein